jgi:hypothetical protein
MLKHGKQVYSRGVSAQEKHIERYRSFPRERRISNDRF